MTTKKKSRYDHLTRAQLERRVDIDGRHRVAMTATIAELSAKVASLEQSLADASVPIPMLLWCPECGERHVVLDRFATEDGAHHTHACQHCGHVWRPARVATVGVRFLPGYKDA